jgi:succinate dehydrogenase / fumarate reductase cytochrome b subunit
MQPSERPVFLQLQHIHLPITGWVSITHRLTGALLFLLLPLPLYLWQRSLQGAAEYAQVLAWLGQWPLRLLLLLLLWWFAHHLFAGLRVLLLDLEYGVALAAARRSARWVFYADAAVLLAGGLWLL